MIYKSYDFGPEGDIVFEIKDKGRQSPSEGDGVNVSVEVIHNNLPFFGERVRLKDPNTRKFVFWFDFFVPRKQLLFVFSGSTYHEAIENAKQWIDEVAKTIEMAVITRQTVGKCVGVPPI